jgi:hypothetical protein
MNSFGRKPNFINNKLLLLSRSAFLNRRVATLQRVVEIFPINEIRIYSESRLMLIVPIKEQKKVLSELKVKANKTMCISTLEGLF